VKTPSRVATAARRAPSLLEVIDAHDLLTVVRLVQVHPKSLEVQMKPFVSTAARSDPSPLDVIDVHVLVSDESLRVQVGAAAEGLTGATSAMTDVSSAVVKAAWNSFLNVASKRDYSCNLPYL
jgi:hypothetical protein